MSPKTKSESNVSVFPIVQQFPAAFAGEWIGIAPRIRPAPVHEVWIDVSPEIAAHWLSTRNTKNRPIRPSRVEALARDIKCNNFKQTHQGVAFDVDGVLCDGQHRLSAIVHSGVPLLTRVSFGLPKDAINAIDSNLAPRGHGDIMGINGKPNARNRASMARCIVLLEFGARMKNVSFAQVDATEARFTDAITWALGHASSGDVKTASAAALAYAYTVAPTKVSEFARQVVSMIGLQENSPAYQLSRALRAPRVRVENGRAKSLQGDEYALSMMLKTLRACMSHVRGEQLGRLYDTDEGFKFFKSERLRLGLD